jgi:hypothetical protein
MNKYFIIIFIYFPNLSHSNNNFVFSETINIPFKNKVYIDKTNNQNFQRKQITSISKLKTIVKKEKRNSMELSSFNINSKEINQITYDTPIIQNEDFNNFIQRMEYIGFIEDKNEIKLFIKYNNILITPKTGSTFEELYKIKNITSEKIFFLNIKNLSIYEYSLPKRSNYEQY